MNYVKTYFVRVFGTVTSGLLTGKVLDGREMDVTTTDKGRTEDASEAIAWAIQRKADFVSNGKVEVWSKQFVPIRGHLQGGRFELLLVATV